MYTQANRAGTVHGPPHKSGGVKFVLNTGHVIEEEGKEVNIPQELLADKTIHIFRGSNKNILHRILKLAGLSAFDKVEDVRYGDVVICMRSAEDKTIRTVKGTIAEILDQVNQSNGCKPVISNRSSVIGKQPNTKLSLKQKIKDWQTENPNSPRWQKKRERIQEISNNTQRLRMNVSRDVQSDDEKTALTTLVIAVMLNSAERVGNDDSAADGHFGVTGFKKEHISVVGNKVHLEYVGKSGTKHEKSFSDERIAKALKKAIKNSPSKFVFETSDGFRIKADKVNRYLERFNITAKDIRGYLANKWLIEKLHSTHQLINSPTADKARKERKTIFNKALKETAGEVGHGRGTLKKHYMIPELMHEYIENGRIIDMKNLGYYEGGGQIKNNFVNMKSEKQISQETILDAQSQLRKLGVSEDEIKKLSQPDKRGLYDKLFQKVFDSVNQKLEEGGTAGNDLAVAEEIRRQIGHKALYMLGAKDLAGDKYSFQFKIRGSKKWKHIKIFLNGKDLYDITFSTWHGDKLTKKTVNDVYADNLHKVIEEETGLYTKLAEGGIAGDDIEKAKLKYAKEDIALLEKQGSMAITDTKHGILWGNHSNGVFSFNDNKGNDLFKGNKQQAIEFVKNAYTIEGDIKLPTHLLNEDGGIAGEPTDSCGCFHSYLIEECPELCAKLEQENVNENAELRAEVDEAREEFLKSESE